MIYKGKIFSIKLRKYYFCARPDDFILPHVYEPCILFLPPFQPENMLDPKTPKTFEDFATTNTYEEFRYLQNRKCEKHFFEAV